MRAGQVCNMSSKIIPDERRTPAYTRTNMISETKIPISVAPLFIIHSLKLEVCHEWLPLLWQRTDQYAGISFVIIIKAEFNRRRRHYEVRSQRIGLAARFVVCYVPIR